MSEIDSSKEGIYRENGPGILLYMKNGETWFHPYSGKDPVKESNWKPK